MNVIFRICPADFGLFSQDDSSELFDFPLLYPWLELLAELAIRIAPSAVAVAPAIVAVAPVVVATAPAGAPSTHSPESERVPAFLLLSRHPFRALTANVPSKLFTYEYFARMKPSCVFFRVIECIKRDLWRSLIVNDICLIRKGLYVYSCDFIVFQNFVTTMCNACVCFIYYKKI